LSPQQRRYVMAQFAFAIIGALLIADLYVRQGVSVVLIPCILLWTQLYTVGLLNEGRSTARRMEWLRLLLVVPGAYLLLLTTVGDLLDPATGWLVIALYMVTSAAWLWRVPVIEQVFAI